MDSNSDGKMSDESSKTKLTSRLFYSDCFRLAEFSDVKLISNSGECFYSNRILLSSASKLFQSMLLDSSLHEEEITYIFSEYSSETLRLILDFVAGGILRLSNNDACQNGVVTDRQILYDFLSFGIDLSSLQLTPFEMTESEKSLLFDHQSFVLSSQVVIKRELDEDLELENFGENTGYQSHHYMFNPVIELKKRKKEARPKVIKPKPKRVKKPKVEIEFELEPEVEGSDEEFVDDGEGSDTGDGVGEPKKKGRKNGDDGSDGGKTKTKSGKFKKSKYRRKEYCGKTEGERDPEKKFQCPYCIRGYDSLKMFKLHVLRHEAADGRTVFFCLQCGVHQRFETAEELKKHKADFHVDKIYTCDRCGKVYNGNYYHRFKAHIAEHDTPKKKYTCNDCGHEASTNKALAKHKVGNGPFHDGKCAHCGKKFETWREHQRHISSAHDGVNLYKCGMCPENFEKAYHQRVHRRDVHHKGEKKEPPGPPKTVVCQSCGKLVRECYYETHLANHHGTGEHPCNQCGRVYPHPSVLERHIASYHNPFPCEKCGKTIRSRVKLRLHNLAAHTPENMKPHQCTVCDPPRGFHTLKTYRDHMNIHTNERPYKCHVCNAGFNNEANMFAHVRSTHKGIKRKK